MDTWIVYTVVGGVDWSRLRVPAALAGWFAGPTTT